MFDIIRCWGTYIILWFSFSIPSFWGGRSICCLFKVRVGPASLQITFSLRTRTLVLMCFPFLADAVLQYYVGAPPFSLPAIFPILAGSTPSFPFCLFFPRPRDSVLPSPPRPPSLLPDRTIEILRGGALSCGPFINGVALPTDQCFCLFFRDQK